MKTKSMGQVKSKILILLFFASALSLQSFGQATVDFSYRTYELENDEENIIQNAAHLDDFFEELLQLKVTGKGKINIVHIGDSHIQADYMTSVVRRNFQHDFGNAGRGLIVPLRVAGTNEPPNYRTSSNVFWNSKRCTHPLQPLPIGVGGVTISTDKTDAELSITMIPKDPIDYSFNSATLFFQKDASSYEFVFSDTTNQELAALKAGSDEPFTNYSKIEFPKAVKYVNIKTQRSSDQQKQATIFGVDLENGHDGILYHAIGVNGAKFSHYNSALYFAKQTQGLQPAVFIISLGTNESIDYPYLDRSILQHIDKMVQSLSQVNPNAKFILVTPPDAFRRKVKFNPGIETIRELIIQYAVENGLAFWDMYKTTGGKNSAARWRSKGLLRPDGIHFSKDGYEYQGNLFYKAMMKSYNNYVPLRHP